MLSRILTVICIFAAFVAATEARADIAPYEEVIGLSGIVDVGDLPEPVASEAALSVSSLERIQNPELQANGATPQVNVLLDGTDASVQPAGASVPSAEPVVEEEFAALDGGDNVSSGLEPFAPADTQIGVGPSHVVEMVNHVGRVYDKNTMTVVSTFKLNDFFGVPAPRCLEGASAPCWFENYPVLRYDNLSGRWFAIYMSFIDRQPGQADTEQYHLAISQTSDPTGQ